MIILKHSGIALISSLFLAFACNVLGSPATINNSPDKVIIDLSKISVDSLTIL